MSLMAKKSLSVFVNVLPVPKQLPSISTDGLAPTPADALTGKALTEVIAGVQLGL
jgi:hypothetical protein